ncbi:glutathione-regulated potassium-efflux system protein KefB [Crenobacter sp. HX-7-9]|uniref:Glutathione-regulated potassium-efflux system protein KefB n=2 Tax=Crenobacter caeni TaxID=2705474 RepID=A0A6B2KNT6_9NEIS|nr:glutathione-regulated potassium-efflux system protein KefB [Crenobacter caeni]
MLTELALLLAAAVFVVPLFRRLGLGAVLGYLLAGLLIGPSLLGLVDDVERISALSELGVVLLLFVIGLELAPARLWVMRRAVFGLGGAQVLSTALLFGGVAWWLSIPWQGALVVGTALALSSTALVIQSLAERKQLASEVGRDAFAVLLMQDLSAIPLMSLMPALAGQAGGFDAWHALRLLVLVGALLLGGRYLLRPLLRYVAQARSSEVFTASALLVVTAAALLAEWAGLSMSLGAFLAGVLLSGSEYRHALEADINPFKGLLLGLFFMAVGMGVRLDLIVAAPLLVCTLLLAWMAGKYLLLLLLSFAAGRRGATPWRFALMMMVGGEFAFVLLALARSHQLLQAAAAELLTVVVTLSMLLSPVLVVLAEKAAALRRPPERPADTIDERTPVLIIGFGRVGQIVARLLQAHGLPFTAIDIDAGHIEFVRRFGNRVYYGDARNAELLRTAGAADASLIVLAIGKVDVSLEVARLIRDAFPGRPLLARARNRQHVYQLWQLGIEQLWRETFASSLEMAEAALVRLGVAPERARQNVGRFRERDEALLRQQAELSRDEAALAQSSRQALAELQALFEQASASEGRERER